MMRGQMLYVEIIYDKWLFEELILWLCAEKRCYARSKKIACDMQNE